MRVARSRVVMALALCLAISMGIAACDNTSSMLPEIPNSSSTRAAFYPGAPTITPAFTTIATSTSEENPCSSGCPGATDTPIPIPTHAPQYYANKIVQWEGDTSTSWLVTGDLGDLRRYPIPNDGSTFDCLTSSGFAFAGAISSKVLDQLPILNTSSAACGKNALYVNQRLFRGSYLRTSDGNYTLKLQRSDGNLVHYGPNGAAVWTNSQSSDYLVLQNGGNLVSYRWLAGGGAASTWSTNTGGSGATKLAIQNGGKLILYTDSGTAVWDSINGKL